MSDKVSLYGRYDEKNGGMYIYIYIKCACIYKKRRRRLCVYLLDTQVYTQERDGDGEKKYLDVISKWDEYTADFTWYIYICVCVCGGARKKHCELVNWSRSARRWMDPASRALEPAIGYWAYRATTYPTVRQLSASSPPYMIARYIGRWVSRGDKGWNVSWWSNYYEK